MNLQLKIFPLMQSQWEVYVRSAYIPPEAYVIVDVRTYIWSCTMLKEPVFSCIIQSRFNISRVYHAVCTRLRTPGSWEKKTPARIHNEAGDHVDNVNCFNQR